MFVKLFLILAPILAKTFAHSIENFGAVPNSNSNDAAHKNSKAITDAIFQANENLTDREVLIPAGKVFFVFNVEAKNLFNITLRIEGIMVLSDNISEWENIMGHPPASSEFHLASFHITNSESIEITGGGVIDGQGYEWWVYVFTSQTHADHRPFLVHMEHCKNVHIHHLLLRNSPFWHMNLNDMLTVHIHDIEIFVEIEKQKKLMKQFGHWDEKLNIPTFPLNTDGIDPSGRDVLIENSRIECFDDAVAVKPMERKSNQYSNCSQDMTIRNMQIGYGVGMTIGSVSPSDTVRCVRNITFANINFVRPLKAIYIKTDPGDSGTAIIEDITYRNIYSTGALWIPIYIGPQQQKQPGTSGTGCSFFYPLIKDCPTQPLVQINNILLDNVTMENSLLLPGVILCDNTTKCKNMTFINVQNTGHFLLRQFYDCHNVEGTKQNSNRLPLNCMKRIQSSTLPRTTSHRTTSSRTTSSRTNSPRTNSPRTTHSGMGGSTSKMSQSFALPTRPKTTHSGSTTKMSQSSTQSFASATTSKTSGASKNYFLFGFETLVLIIFFTII